MSKRKTIGCQVGDRLEVTIESLSYFGGRGVARHDGVVLFVPYSAPQDRLTVEITDVKPRFLEAKIVEILVPGPGRREPPCPVAGRCGGCAWQHVSYSEQLIQKEKILNDSLSKVKASSPQHKREFLSSTTEFGYRNRIQVQSQNGELGFFASRTRTLVPTRHCWIAEPAINEKLKALDANKWPNSRVEIARLESGSVTINPSEVGEAGAFGQVHSLQNEVLKKLVVESVTCSPAWILDLYAGSGNLTFELAKRFLDVPITAIELSRRSTELGMRKASELSFDKQVKFILSDVSRGLTKVFFKNSDGVVVLDPPRPGLDNDVIQSLLRLNPAQIVYVSCNPTTFARDAQRLLEAGQFDWASVQGLDMFPQTEHVELVAVFNRRTLN